MALPTFDPAKHHVGLGPTGDQKGILVDASYQRGSQRYGSPSEFGGERDQLEPSVLSRWTQDDFGGGGGQELWGEDPAMFTRSKNLLPALVGRSARTVPPLIFFTDAGTITADTSLGVFATGGKNVAVIDADKVRFYDAETGAVTNQQDLTHDIQVAAHDPSDNKVYTVVSNNTTNRKYLVAINPSGRSTIAEFPASLDTHNAKGIETTAGRDVVVAFGGTSGQTLWLADVNDARDDATFTRVGRLPGSWRDSVTYNGMTYILLTDTEQTTQVVSWDGTSILPVAVFPYNFLGKAIDEYGGRLYVCGSVADITDVDRYAALYEITASSLRLVKSYADESRAGLTVPSTFYEMVVHDGTLFVGGDIGWVCGYDITRDGLWSEIEIRSETGARTLQARRLLSTREKLFAWCYDPNRTNPEDGFYRMATDDADLGAITYDCELETSDFAPDPSREKRLSEVQILTRAATGVPEIPVLEYTVNGGDNWTTVANDSTTQSGRFRETVYDLSAIDTTKIVRLRFTITKDSVGYEEFIAFTLSFLILDTDKRTWRFTVIGTERPEQLDRSTLVNDIGTLDETLWTWKAESTLLDFTDINGDVRRVQITDIGTTAPSIGGRLPDGTREGFYSLALTEV